MNNTKRNFIYNIIYQVFTYIIPLIITPYISRVLGSSNIGIYAYSYSIVYYFMLGTLLGLNNYGPKNIAKVSTDKEKLSREFCSIYYLQLIAGILMLIGYNLMIAFMPYSNKKIFIIQNIFLLSSVLDINWFYFGLEKFKLTISRNVIIKMVSLIFILFFVKTQDDLWKYTLIMAASTLISQLYLWIFLRHHIKFRKVKIRDVFVHLKPCLILFITVISYSVYKVMDKTMLGAIAGSTQLGYYENAEKIINIPISLITALGTVSFAAMSKFGDNKQLRLEKIKENFKISYSFIIPMALGMMAVSKDFASAFFGEDFAKSGEILFMLAPTMVFVATASVIRTCFLIPNSREKVYVGATVFGAVVNLLINVILIPQFGYYGACVGTIAAEFSVMFIQILYVRKDIPFYIISKAMLPFLVKAMIMLFGILAAGEIFNNLYLRLIVEIITGIVVYFILNYKYFIYDFFNL